MGFIKNTALFIVLLNLVCLFGHGSATFRLLKNGLFKQALSRSILAPKCSPSMKPLPALKDITDFRTCLKPIPLINGSRRHPEQDMRVSQVILRHGYNLVTYDNVTTEDGYILTVYRILGNAEHPTKQGKPAVLLFHGIGTASDEWVLQSDAKKNLPMKLVDQGYEVWLANARGTDLSRVHGGMKRSEVKYWNFSFHEMGVYDLPAIINLMTEETGNPKIFFVGHNYAANVYAAGLSEKPELNDKIEAAVLLGPTIFLGHTSNPLRPLFRSAIELPPLVQEQVNVATRGNMRFGNWMLNPILARFCTPTAIKCGVCGNLIFFLYGFDAPQIEFNNIPNWMSKVPNAISFKTALHMGQSIKSCDFRKFDYGRFQNIRIYGQDNPPQYNLTNLRAPVYIYVGNGDNLATLEDIVMTKSALPEGTLKEIYRVQWKLFNNVDFVIAKDADTLVYNHIIDNFSEYAAKYKVKKIASGGVAAKTTAKVEQTKKPAIEPISVSINNLQKDEDIVVEE